MLPIRALYTELNPSRAECSKAQSDKRLDSQLRADSKDSGLRVKRRKGLVPSQDSREAHISFAKFQVKALLTESVTVKMFGRSDRDRSFKVDSFWDKIYPPNVGGDRIDTPLTLRKVLTLCELVEALPDSNVERHSSGRIN